MEAGTPLVAEVIVQIIQSPNMELLAILSTIILVGTIATLILAVAAYVLYKVRERKRGVVRSVTAIPAVAHHVLSAAAYDRPRAALPVARPFELSDLRAPSDEQPNGPVEAATYVPPKQLRSVEPALTSTAFWEYTPEPLGRTDRQPIASPAYPAGDGLAWL